jgi:hypothetical protein
MNSNANEAQAVRQAENLARLQADYQAQLPPGLEPSATNPYTCLCWDCKQFRLKNVEATQAEWGRLLARMQPPGTSSADSQP